MSKMDLIDRNELRMIVYTTGRCNGKTALIEAFSRVINSAQKIDAIPVDWIEKHISEIEDDVPNVAGAFKGLIEIWKEEKENQE